MPRSLSARRAWIEIGCFGSAGTYSPSLSARRAWIEIAILLVVTLIPLVALRKESVDRNGPICRRGFRIENVALRKESVDRNISNYIKSRIYDRSLSARRAWIEIYL